MPERTSSRAPRVEIVNWNPRRSLVRGKYARFFPRPSRVGNFGDLIGPLVVQLLLERAGLRPDAPIAAGRLLSVGSVMHLARTGDVIWGTGVNGKVEPAAHTFTDLDVRAVRGPRTREFLQSRGIAVPAVYGDPALLLPGLHPELRGWAGEKRHRVTVVPNLNDFPQYAAAPSVLSPTAPLDECLRRIAQSELVVGSSLHGVIVAESLGIPARLIRSGAESPFKYADYYEGSGRDGFEPAETVDDAVRMGGEPPIRWSPEPLAAAFPLELWRET